MKTTPSTKPELFKVSCDAAEEDGATATGNVEKYGEVFAVWFSSYASTVH